jgi:EAL domain-containing protein (putative c-di-GMP-specific phosphodiesterase class I)
MATGAIYGAEALIRWNHPEKGILSPVAFLPDIEGTTLEISIGNWVIHQGLKHLVDFTANDFNLEVSINIASFHLQSDSFYQVLEHALNDHPSISPHQLQLEILESSALSDLTIISDIIKTCQQTLGVSIALDDFGTGYSSLSHLRRLGADTIKIDQSFIRDILDDPEDLVITDSVIKLSNSFQANVIAEGVETLEQGLILLVLGCVNAQGYGIAKPMPAHSFHDWLKSYTPNQKWVECGKEQLSPKEKRRKLYRLLSGRWHSQFIQNISDSTQAPKHWPIFDIEHCHCGTLLKLEDKEGYFNKSSILNVQSLHNEFHHHANKLYSQYIETHQPPPKEALDAFNKTYEKMEYTIATID